MLLVPSIASAKEPYFICIPCPAGTYSEDSECKPCPDGYYCKNGEKNECSKIVLEVGRGNLYTTSSSSSGANYQAGRKFNPTITCSEEFSANWNSLYGNFYLDRHSSCAIKIPKETHSGGGVPQGCCVGATSSCSCPTEPDVYTQSYYYTPYYTIIGGYGDHYRYAYNGHCRG